MLSHARLMFLFLVLVAVPALTGVTACSSDSSRHDREREETATSAQAITGDCSASNECVVTVRLPRGTRWDTVVLAASNRLKINDGVALKELNESYANAVHSGTAAPVVDSNAGSQVQIGSLWSVPSAELRSGGVINGDLRTSGSYLPQDNSSTVRGTIQQNAQLELYEALRWTVQFPSDMATDVALDSPNDPRPPATEVAPGAYDQILLKPRSRIQLRTGTYYLNDLVAEVDSEILVDNANGPVVLNIRKSLAWAGTLIPTVVLVPNTLFTYLGTGGVSVARPLHAAVVAPNAEIDLRSVGFPWHRGLFFAKRVEVHQWQTVYHRAFQRQDCATVDPEGCGAVFGCAPKDIDGDGLTDCEEKNDGDGWTDYQAYNGMVARLAPPCAGGATCSSVDTAGEVTSCVDSQTVTATQFVRAGWNAVVNSGGVPSCSAQRGFAPAWLTCLTSWQVEATGKLKLDQGGQHCFAVEGETSGECASLLVGNETSAITTGNTRCFQLAAGVYDIRWLYNSTAEDTSGYRIRYCAGGTEPCAPTEAIPSRMLRAEYDGSSPCDTTGNTCTELCPCAAGQGPCNDNTCSAGLVCGTDNGGHFAKSGRVCWPEGCPNAACGSLSDACGYCAAGPPACSTDADCAGGEVCGRGNGIRFYSDATDGDYPNNVCWSAQCPGAGCGPDPGAPCGACICEPNCAEKQCGDDTSDGCGGTCTQICAKREIGCKTDSDCEAGTVCGIGVGERFGFASGTNVCWSAACEDHDRTRIPCGSTDSECGTCPTCDSSCSGSCADPDNGGSVPAPATSPQTVGAIPASFSVSDRGTATYVVPIEVPPGRAGLAPSVSLRYTSTKSNGVLGVGWSMDGLSVITRCQPSPRLDGLGGPVRWDRTDQFCLDGKRLVVDPDHTHGANGAEYRTELDTFVKVVARGETARGPEYFEAWTKDGRIMRFGGAPNSRMYADTQSELVRGWALDSIEDRSGNVINVRYLKFEDCRDTTDGEDACSGELCGTVEFLPDTITYGGSSLVGTTLEADRWLKFVYEKVPGRHWDSVEQYVYGVRTVRSRLLKRVDTHVAAPGRSTTRVSSYHVEYDDPVGPPNNSRVAKIWDCRFGSAGAQICKPPTKFEYNDEKGFEDAVEVALFPGVTANDPNLPAPMIRGVFDINGDGREDIVGQVRLRAKGTYEDPYVYVSDPKADGHFTRHRIDTGVSTLAEIGPRVLSHPQLLMSGTERRGLAEISRNADGSYHAEFSDLNLPVVNNSRAEVNNNYTQVMIGDFDLNGVKDVISQGARKRYSDSDCTPKHIRFRPTLDGIDVPVPWYGLCLSPLTRMDVDGDRNPDVLRYGDEGWKVLRGIATDEVRWEPVDVDLPVRIRRNEYDRSVFTDFMRRLDINGDLLPDFVRFTGRKKDDGIIGGAPLATFVNTGRDKFIGRMQWPSSVASEMWEGSQNSIVVNYDSNRTQDILKFPHFGGDVEDERWVVGYGSASKLLLVDFADMPALKPHGSSIGGDFDGDGNADILIFAGFPEIPDRREPRWYLLRGRGARGNLLKRAEDGLGKTVLVNYLAEPLDGDLRRFRTYMPGRTCSDEAVCESNPGPLVGRYEIVDVGGPPESLVVLQYEDARKTPDGEWLGFAKRTEIEWGGTTTLDLRMKRRTEITYDNSTYRSSSRVYPFAGRVTHVRDEIYADQAGLNNVPTDRITETTNLWAVKSSRGARRPFPYLESSTTDVYDRPRAGPEMPLLRRTVVPKVDDLGNVLEQTITVQRGDAASAVELSYSRINSVFDVTDAEYRSWRIGEPDRVEVLSRRDGTTHSRVTSFDYYDSGLPRQITREPEDSADALKHQAELTYSFGNVDTIVEREFSGRSAAPTRSSRVTYDERQLFPHVVTNSKDQSLTIEHDLTTGQRTKLVDANGLTSTWSYDEFGRVMELSEPGQTTFVSYSAAAYDDSNVVVVKGRYQVEAEVFGGAHSAQVFDGFGRLVQTRAYGFKGEVVQQEFAYEKGLLRQASRPHVKGDFSQGVTEYHYDLMGRLVQQDLPDGNEVLYGYGTRNTLAAPHSEWVTRDTVEVRSVTDAKDHTELVYRGIAGAPVRTVDAAGQHTDYSYGPFNALTRVRDYAGNVTTLVPDAYGRVLEHTDPDVGKQKYTYTGFDEVHTHTDASGRSAMFQYDALGRLTSRADSDGTTTWAYDGPGPNALGRLHSATSPPGLNGTQANVTEYAYEAGGRGFLHSITRTIQAPQQLTPETFVTKFEYGPSGDVSKVSYPSAASQPFEVGYEYDGYGNLAAVYDVATPSQRYWEMLEADQGYRAGTERFGNNLTTTRSYHDLTGYLKTITTGQSGAVQNASFTYDPNGNLEGIALHNGGAAKWFTYDVLDRLDTATTRPVGAAVGTTEDYNYDALGNITFKTGVGTYDYSWPTTTSASRPHAVRTAGGHEFAYDDNGNVSSRSGSSVPNGTQSFRDYTAFNLPRTIVTGPSDSGFTTTLEYDAFQQRVIKHSANVNGAYDETTTYVGGEYEKVVDESQAKTFHRYFVYGGGRQVAQVERTEQAGILTDERMLYLHADHLGSIEAVTDQTGAVIDERSYTAWGALEKHDMARSGVRAGFTGHEHDRELGLINMRGRLYDPIVARFTSADPIVQAPYSSQSLNRYSYVWNNPVNLTDPSGFESTVNNSELVFEGAGETSSSGGWAYHSTGEMAGYSSYGGEGVFQYDSYGPQQSYSYTAASMEPSYEPGWNVSPAAEAMQPMAIVPPNPSANGSGDTSAASSANSDWSPAAENEARAAGAKAAAMDWLGSNALLGSVPFGPPAWAAAWYASKALSDAAPTAPSDPRLAAAYNETYEGVSTLAMALPGGKSVGTAAATGAGAASRVVGQTPRNLQKFFGKHGSDFGLTGSWSPSRAADASRAINQHLNSPGVRAIEGAYRGNPATHYLDPSTGLNVVADGAGNFITGYKLGAEQLNDVLTTGHLW